MEHILRPIYQERASQPNTLGVLLVEKRRDTSPVTDLFDAVLLIIVKEAENEVFTKHYIYEEKKAAMHVITEAQLNQWLLLGSNRKMVDWLFNGKVLFDRNEYIEKLKIELRDFPFYGRKIKMGMEFAKLIRRYIDGKAFFEAKHYLDAYNHIVHSLHHLARLSVIENGFHPELTVWKQVKQIEPEIFKLYSELVSSEEPIEKRLELLFIASEFMIHSRTASCSAHIMDIMKEQEIWTIQELQNHKHLQHYSVDLGVLLEYLIEKKFIDIHKTETKGQYVYHRLYKSVK
ncbi:nucleotidyltransferase-like protein [Bacillus sp. 2205SS5-2]|uniref:nucleotidyltransferase-like protein n=1 Tax=Bacillus sp. 2205SS5-2 TaxID=3109031 RepID=UPI003005D8CA